MHRSGSKAWFFMGRAPWASCPGALKRLRNRGAAPLKMEQTPQPGALLRPGSSTAIRPSNTRFVRGWRSGHRAPRGGRLRQHRGMVPLLQFRLDRRNQAVIRIEQLDGILASAGLEHWLGPARHAVRERLGTRPGRVYLMKPRAVPRTSNGKIRYETLREEYSNGSWVKRTGGKVNEGWIHSSEFI